jgi:putative membrane protein
MLGWRRLINHDKRPSRIRLLILRWITETVNNLLPVAQIGGEITRARLLAQRGVDATIASSSVLVDFTTGLFAQALFTLAGVMLLLKVVGASTFVVQTMSALLLFIILLFGFFYFQSQGLKNFSVRIAQYTGGRERWSKIITNTHTFAGEVENLYRQRGRLLKATGWRLAGWFTGVGETFLILFALQIPAPFTHFVILESFTFAARSLGFLIPGAIGITEGALVLVGTLLGLSPAQALTLALVRRARELLLGIPGLAVWFVQESRINRPDKNPQ